MRTAELPLIEYYLQQFAQAQTTYGMRLLDYVDLHTYFAATYQRATRRLHYRRQHRASSRRGSIPRAPLGSELHRSQFSAAQLHHRPQLHRKLLHAAAGSAADSDDEEVGGQDYPGTKLAIDEYNWGGMEAINGALAQADILGIFGREGLDLGTMWPTSDPSGQIPGMMAFAMYRNYDGNNSTFGDTALASTSAGSGADAEGTLSVYGALRTSDNAVTIMVINKTYGNLTETLSVANLKPNGPAQSYLYSNANLAAIVKQANVAVTAAVRAPIQARSPPPFPRNRSRCW